MNPRQLRTVRVVALCTMWAAAGLCVALVAASVSREEWVTAVGRAACGVLCIFLAVRNMLREERRSR